jgi:hypothetical protein
MLTIEGPIAKPVSQEIISEFERQIRFRLPNSYRDFLLKHNGGHPVPDFIDLPPSEDLPAQVQNFYGLDADEWHHDAWTKFKFFDTRIPFGLLMFGALTLECAELCFDFRRHPGTSIYSRFCRFLFARELLDPETEDIPVKFFDWRYFNETRKVREKDLYPVAASFEELIGKLRTLTPAEEAKLEGLMPKPNQEDAAKAQRELAAMKLKPKDWQQEANRPPRLADLVGRKIPGTREIPGTLF